MIRVLMMSTTELPKSKLPLVDLHDWARLSVKQLEANRRRGARLHALFHSLCPSSKPVSAREQGLLSFYSK